MIVGRVFAATRSDAKATALYGCGTLSNTSRTHFSDRWHFSMAKPNSTWRVNQQDMKRCCYVALQHEMYRRQHDNEELMAMGQTFNCSTCNTEMACGVGLSGRLRWALPDPPEVKQQ